MKLILALTGKRRAKSQIFPMIGNSPPKSSNDWNLDRA